MSLRRWMWLIRSVGAAVMVAGLVGIALHAGLIARAGSPSRPVHGAIAASSPPSCALSTLARITSPNVGSRGSELTGIATASSTDVWAVGYSGYINGPGTTLIEHSAGSTWVVVPSPNPGVYADFLQGIAALASNNAWAVGYQKSSFNDPGTTLIEQWNGSSWTVSASANTSQGNNQLAAIAAIAPNDIWAVGGSTSTLTEHWDGSSWSVVPSPNAGTTPNYLTGVAGTSTNDVWAVGYTFIPGQGYVALVEHWDGTAWSIVSTPTGSNIAVLSAISAVSSNDVWVAGYIALQGVITTTLVEHWNGTTWSIVPTPNAGNGTQNNSLESIDARSSTDIWAVGKWSTDSVGNHTSTIAIHWNGTTWSVIPSADGLPPSTNSQVFNDLVGVVALSSTQVWAVGYTASQPFNSDAQTVVEQLRPNPLARVCPR